ncbi:MAG: diguanylate cyclase [Actinobacteria bacterium]|nr:diguanylate cyclase [Actinomycetota bacterium]
MALRSQEEVSLATVFARALRGVIAITTSEERRVWPEASDVLGSTPESLTAPASLVRLLQFSVLPEILGESAGPAIYLAAKRATSQLGITSIQGLKDWFGQMQLGDLEVELDDERVLVKLHGCLSCADLRATGTPVCDVERGFIDGVLEQITGTEVLTKETQCGALGDTVCQFEGYAGQQAGYLYQENGFHPDEQRRLLTQLADQADVALDNLRLLHERREHETHDALTGLLNFRQLRERARFELARAERHERTVAFVMLDLDGFAAVNETAGREAGDEVLRHWAAALTAQLRSCDLVCRYGADEFLLVLPETADQQADAALARVLRTMEQLAVETDGHSIALSATAGVATFPADGRSAEELVAKAATTMYAAKASGPNRVAFYAGSQRA